MVKPVIIKRNVKGSALTFSELDTNFQNLDDATINFHDDFGGQLSMDLNDITTVRGQENHNVKVTVSEDSNGRVITVDNILSDYTQEPMGFENRVDSTISFNNGTRQFTITPGSNGFRVWCKGEMFTKTTAETVTITNTTGLYFIYYNSSGTLASQTDYFDWDDETPVAYIYWNATAGVGKLADERHGITLDWATHQYLHRTRGAAFANGFAASNYTTAGDGSSNSHAQIDLANGTFFDEDIDITVTHSNSPTANTFEQDLQGPAQIPVAYHSGSTGTWVFDAARDYPVKNGTSLVTYNLNTAGTWSTPDISTTYYVAYWIVATNFLTTPVIAIMGQSAWNKLEDAENNSTWDSLDLSNFPSREFVPLYRLIFRSGSAYTNTPKAYLAEITDYRSTTAGGGSAVTLAPNGFGTISVSGQDDIIAESVNDSVTFVEGTGITITTNATTDSITIAASPTYAAYNLGTVSGTVSPDVANGNVQYLTVSGNITVNGFTNPVAGQELALVINQPTTGSTYNLSTVMRLGYIVGGYGFNGSGFAEGVLLTQTNSAVDVMHIVYDGQRYYARIENDFRSAYTWDSLDTQTWDSWWGDIWDF